MSALLTNSAVEGLRAPELNSVEKGQLHAALTILDAATSIRDIAVELGASPMLVGETNGSKIYLAPMNGLDVVFTVGPEENIVVAHVRRASTAPSGNAEGPDVDSEQTERGATKAGLPGLNSRFRRGLQHDHGGPRL